MPTNLTPQQMKQFVRDHFDEFVNKRNAAVIRRNMTPDFYDHDGPGGKPTGVEGDEQMIGRHVPKHAGFAHHGRGDDRRGR